jgi:8-oxo-dGTP diphosphatase
MPHRSILGVHMIFERGGRVLLGKRAPTAAFAPDTWHVPAGHVEDESARACAIREAAEELAVTVDDDGLELVHLVHLRDPENNGPRVQLFFRVHRWKGEPINNETDRCTELAWWPTTALPTPLVDYTRAALAGIAHGRMYTEMGWAQ